MAKCPELMSMEKHGKWWIINENFKVVVYLVLYQTFMVELFAKMFDLHFVKNRPRSWVKELYLRQATWFVNPNKAGVFEGSFFWGSIKLTLPSYFKKT